MNLQQAVLTFDVFGGCIGLSVLLGWLAGVISDRLPKRRSR